MTKAINQRPEMIRDQMADAIVETAAQMARTEGAHTITVRRILQALGITNRVFYNRFRNVDDVLAQIYRRMNSQVRHDILSGYDKKTDFFEYVMDVVERSLIISYDIKMQFNQFAFEKDSLSNANYEWWTGEIRRLIDYAKAEGLVREDVDSVVMSYSIWCFCRGYNADAVGRGLPREEAAKNFRYSFGFLLDGMKK